MTKDTNKEIQELQSLEQNFQSLMMQKQAFQIEINETTTALEEMKKSDDNVYRVLGKVMLKADKKDLTKELAEKNKLINLRLKSIEKQELSFREEIERLRNDIVSKMQ